jgi:hypothetical protein
MDYTNQTIHEWLGKCWHVPTTDSIEDVLFADGSDLICSKCDASLAWDYQERRKYDESLDLVRPVELRAIEVFGVNQMANALTDAVHQILPSPDIQNVIFADARTRAFAIVELIGTKAVTGGVEDAGHAIA